MSVLNISHTSQLIYTMADHNLSICNMVYELTRIIGLLSIACCPGPVQYVGFRAI